MRFSVFLDRFAVLIWIGLDLNTPNLVSWSAKRQPILSCSSAEAEYHGDDNVVAESCWLQNLLLKL